MRTKDSVNIYKRWLDGESIKKLTDYAIAAEMTLDESIEDMLRTYALSTFNYIRIGKYFQDKRNV